MKIKFRLDRCSSTYIDDNGERSKWHSTKQTYAIHGNNTKAVNNIEGLLQKRWGECSQGGEMYSDFYSDEPEAQHSLYCIDNSDVEFFKECVKAAKKQIINQQTHL
jgi:hypothetical protein